MNTKKKNYNFVLVCGLVLLVALAVVRNITVEHNILNEIAAAQNKTNQENAAKLNEMSNVIDSLLAKENKIIYVPIHHPIIIVDTVKIEKTDTLINKKQISKNLLQRRTFEYVTSEIPIGPGQTVKVKSKRTKYR